jgi:hypothetical protein
MLRVSKRNNQVKSANFNPDNFVVDAGLIAEFTRKTGTQRIAMSTYAKQLAEAGIEGVRYTTARNGKATFKAIHIPMNFVTSETSEIDCRRLDENTSWK